MPKITLKSWNPGLKKVSLTKLLQEQAGLSLTSAKQYVDRLLADEAVSVNVPTTEEAAQLAEEITKLGAVCEIDSRDETTVHS
jgi:ribosomal protein L7/L12